MTVKSWLQLRIIHGLTPPHWPAIKVLRAVVYNFSGDVVIKLKHCAELAGLNVDELVLGVTPSRRHQVLLKSYLLNLDRGHAKVREMMICDLCGYCDIGAQRVAADLLVVLRMFLTEYFESVDAPPEGEAVTAQDNFPSRKTGAATRARRVAQAGGAVVADFC